MDTILMNLWNNKTSDSHRLALKSLKRRDNYMTYSNLLINYTWKNIKKGIKQ